jgi:hypothetical protein
VELRSAFLQRRMGDLDCFLRAAWAVRADADLYAVKSDNDWHYNYPPLCAILMTPLADPPKGHDTTGFVPYPISVAICFLFNVLCMFAAAHFLASAFEQTSDDDDLRSQPRFCLRWWALRVLPVLICFQPIGHTMVRGQVNLFILATLCAAMAGWMRGHNLRAGLWLSFAICIKVIPVYLLVYPIWKRDIRGLAGCGIGLFAGLVLIPAFTFGPSKTVTHYETYARVFFGPMLGMSDDESRKREITGVNATDSVGVKDALHNWMYAGVAPRPEMHAAGKAAYVLFGLAMTFVTLWPGGRADSSLVRGHAIAALILLMAILSPVCHSHYFLFCMPMAMSLLAHAWHRQASAKVPWLLISCFVIFNVTMAIAYLPGMEILKDRCAALFAALPLWIIPVIQMWKAAPAETQEVHSNELRRAA